MTKVKTVNTIRNVITFIQNYICLFFLPPSIPRLDLFWAGMKKAEPCTEICKKVNSATCWPFINITFYIACQRQIYITSEWSTGLSNQHTENRFLGVKCNSNTSPSLSILVLNYYIRYHDSTCEMACSINCFACIWRWDKYLYSQILRYLANILNKITQWHVSQLPF